MITNITPHEAQSQPAQKHRQWNVLLDGEVIGKIHANSEAQARDIIAPFRMHVLTVEATD